MSRIERDVSFQCGVFFQGHTLLNLYDMTLYMDIVTDEENEQIVAVERIQFLLKNYIEHSIFVSEENKSQINLLEKAGLTVLTIPEEPYDQIVGLILMRKFNAIAEGRIIVSEIKFSSILSSDIRFHNTIEESEEFDEPAWYNDSTLSIHGLTKKTKKDKIVKFDELEDWNKVGLVWKS